MVCVFQINHKSQPGSWTVYFRQFLTQLMDCLDKFKPGLWTVYFRQITNLNQALELFIQTNLNPAYGLCILEKFQFRLWTVFQTTLRSQPGLWTVYFRQISTRLWTVYFRQITNINLAYGLYFRRISAWLADCVFQTNLNSVYGLCTLDESQNLNLAYGPCSLDKSQLSLWTVYFRRITKPQPGLWTVYLRQISTRLKDCLF